jgi:DUF1009 family protein
MAMEPSKHNSNAPEGPLGIICGGGGLPFAVAEAAKRRGRSVLLFAISGFADPRRIADYRHHWIGLGQYGRFRRLCQKEGCREFVLIGSLVRPALGQIRLDWGTLMILPRIISAFRGGDDHLLSGLVRIMERDSFRVIGAHEVAPDIVVPRGPFGIHEPHERDHEDIARGLGLIATIGAFDVGQAVVVANGHVLAVEAVEGTDQMLHRVAELRRSGRIRTPKRTGVLVKAPKPSQDRRIDLPAIGPETVEAAARADLAGIAVQEGHVIIAEPQRVGEAADRAGLFVIGVPSGTTAE